MGALMITIDVSHPDIEDFISIKQDLTKVTGANISVKLTDKFMIAVKKDKDFLLKFDSGNSVFTKKVKAKELWEKIVKAAHKTGEPGLLYWDKQHRYSPSSLYPQHTNISTNP